MPAIEWLAAPRPADEDARLRALKDLGVLDTGSDPVVDELVRLTAELYDVPIALVSLVDAERQWFRAKVGTSACETDRDSSFCGHAILTPDEVLVVPDAHADPRFVHNPFVVGDPYVRFYAGVPLMVNGRHPVGTLCIIDTEPRLPADLDLGPLQRIARVVTARLESRRRTEALATAARSAGAAAIAPTDSTLLALVDRATAVAGSARTLEEAVAELLPELCAVSGSGAGRLLLARASGAAAMPTDVHHLVEGAPLSIRTIAVDRQAVITARGVASAVVASRQALAGRLTEEIEETMVPILVGQDICGFVHLARAIEADEPGPEPALLSVLSNVGSQLGRVVERRLAAAEVQASELAARTVIDTSRDAYLSVDAEGVVSEWNEAAHRVFGWTAAEAIGRTLAALGLPRALIERGARELHTVRSTDTGRTRGTTIEVVAHRRDGTEIEVEMNIWATVIGDEARLRTFARDITDRRARERRLQADEARYRSVFSSAGLGIAIVDRDGRFVEVNDQICAITGHSRTDLLDRTAWSITHPLDVAATDAAADALLDGSCEQSDLEVRLLTPDGGVCWVRVNLVVWVDDRGEVAGFHIHVIDLTAEKEAEAARDEADARFEAAFEHAPIGLALVGLDGSFIRANEALSRITGYSIEQLRSSTFQTITHPDDLDVDLDLLRRTLAGEIDRYEMEKRYLRRDGSLIWVHLGVSLVRDGEGEPRYFVSQIRDVTERKRAELHLTELATRDALTGLANRLLFQTELHQAHRAAEAGQAPYAVVFVDLDGFKPVNDEHGHEAGDLVLVEVGRRLDEISRPTDLTARLGGDEFVVLCRGVADDRALERIIERVRVELSKTYRFAGGAVDGLCLDLSASVGGARYEAGATEDAVMGHADRRMYEAKARR